MFHRQHTLHCPGSILALSTNSRCIIGIDNRYAVSIFDRQSFEPVDRITVSSKFDPRHLYEKSFAASADQQLFFSLPAGGRGYLLGYKQKLHKKANLSIHEKPLSIARFNHSSTLLATGDEEGKGFFHHTGHQRLIGRLPQQPDYVSDITFSQDGLYAAAAYFNQKILLFNMEKEETETIVATDSVPERILFSESGTHLFAVLRNQALFIYDILMQQSIHSNITFDQWPTAMTLIGDRHLLVGTKGEHLYLIDTASFELIHRFSLGHMGVTALQIDGEHLFVSHIDGRIQIIHLNHALERFVLALQTDDFGTAGACIEENRFLLTRKEMKRFDEKWPETIQKAKELIASGDTERAVLLVTPFFVDSKKEEEFRFCQGHIQDFQKFRTLVAERKFPQAFQMSDELVFLKKTDEFSQITEHWHKSLQQAKSLLKLDDAASRRKAREILQPYQSVVKLKNLITNLLDNANRFRQAAALIKSRDFLHYFKLVAAFPFLRDEPLYERVMAIGHQTYAKLKTLEYEGRLDEAVHTGEFLRSFLPLKEQSEEAIILLKGKHALLKAIQTRDIPAVYWLIQTMPELESCNLFRNFHRTFLRIKEEALCHAVEGLAEQAQACLSDYADIPYCFPSVANVMRIAYLNEIEKTYEGRGKLQVDWKCTLRRYVDTFGMEEEIILLARVLVFEEFLEIDDQASAKTAKSFFKIFPSILCLKED